MQTFNTLCRRPVVAGWRWGLVLASLLSLLASPPASAQQPMSAQQATLARRVSLDVPRLRQQLAVPTGVAARAGAVPTYRLGLPTLAGPRTFVLTESFVLPAADAAAQQRLRTFVGYEEGAPSHRTSVVLTPTGLTADLLAGAASASLRPAPNSTDYLLAPAPMEGGACNTDKLPGALLRTASAANQPAPYSFGTQLRRIRYAVLVTNEFYTNNGNADAAVEQAVVAALNQMSALYQEELAVSYELAKPTGGTYYFSAVTTATLSSNAAATPGRLRYQNLSEVGALIGARFATSSYDVGHCYHNDGGGVAYVGVVCSTNQTYRAGAWSGVPTSGLRYVLTHEMGHQQGASHSFSGSCGATTPGSEVEPSTLR